MQLPPAPVGTPFGSYTWADWYEKIRFIVSNTDFNHNDLKNIQGGNSTERYHLTLPEYSKISTITSGMYTPTITMTSNVLSISSLFAMYSRVGDIVHVVGLINVSPNTLFNQTSWYITLPIPSNLGLYPGPLAGTIGTEIGGMGGSVYHNGNNGNTAFFLFTANDNASNQITFNFMYRIQ